MFGFDASLFIVGKPENLLPMRGHKFPREQQYPARRAVSNPFAGRAHDLVTARRGRAPRPSALVIQHLALRADGWLREFTLTLVRVVLPCPNRSIFFVPRKV
jgi:hypothetical protein